MLKKYYNGESSLEEEKQLAEEILAEKNDSAEKEIFRYYAEESKIPANLEEFVLNAIDAERNKRKSIKMKLYSAISAAAVFLIVVSVFLNTRSNRNAKLESEFLVLEQALSQVSETLQPEETGEDLLVLWVDDDVEIIIN